MIESTPYPTRNAMAEIERKLREEPTKGALEAARARLHAEPVGTLADRSVLAVSLLADVLRGIPPHMWAYALHVMSDDAVKLGSKRAMGGLRDG